jgi:trk system potassium uptake protein TrkA
MKQFAIIGLSKFGQHMLEELADTGCELVLIDKDRQRVDQFKDQAAAVYVADALNEDVLEKLVPRGIDAAIVDAGDQTEVSILVTHYLKKLGIREIIAKAESDEHEEILKLVGATRIVRPNTEAARRIAPFLVSSLVFSYLPISRELVIAEVKVPEAFFGKSLIELDLRKKYSLNVIAYRKQDREEYAFYSPDYRLQADDLLLVGGGQEAIARFPGGPAQRREGPGGPVPEAALPAPLNVPAGKPATGLSAAVTLTALYIAAQILSDS